MATLLIRHEQVSLCELAFQPESCLKKRASDLCSERWTMRTSWILLCMNTRSTCGVLEHACSFRSPASLLYLLRLLGDEMRNRQKESDSDACK